MARKAKKDIVFEYEPRTHFQPFHKRENRWAAMVCHRRAGKTVAAVNELILRALYTKKKNARFAYVAPFYSQAKDVAWQYAKDATEKFATRQRESALRIELPNGAWITLYGSDNPDRLRGLYLDGVVIDEYGDCRPSLWGTVILPCLADRKGWALFIGTPKGRNHFHKIFEDSQKQAGWFSLKLKASESGILDNEELMAMKLQMTDAEWEQEMECNFSAAISGTFYASIISSLELSGRIKPKVVQYDPTLPVHCAADIGRVDSTACWYWQETPTDIHVIDYDEYQGKDPEFFHKEVFGRKPFKLTTLWLPHDAKAKTFATKRSTIEQFLDFGYPCRITPRLDRLDGINAARKILPNCYIDQDKCFAGVEALRAYKRRWDEVYKVFSKDPLHNWASDGSDAFRYLALVCKETLRMPERLLENEKPNYGSSLNDLFSEREHSMRHNTLRI